MSVLHGYTCCNLNIHIRKIPIHKKIFFLNYFISLAPQELYLFYMMIHYAPFHSCFSYQCDGKNVIYPCELMNGPRMPQIKHHFSVQVFPRDFSCINELCSSWKIHEKDLTWPSRFTYLISFMWCVTCKIPFSQRWKCLW